MVKRTCQVSVQALSQPWVLALPSITCGVGLMQFAGASLSLQAASYPLPSAWKRTPSNMPILVNKSSFSECCSSLKANSACPRIPRLASISPFLTCGPLFFNPPRTLLLLPINSLGAVRIHILYPEILGTPQ